MNRVTCMITLTLGAMALMVGLQTANAEIILQHQGQTNPTTEGWNLYGMGGSATVGGVNDGGRNAWQIADAGYQPLYDTVISAPDLAAMVSNGYSYTATICQVSGSDSLANGSDSMATDNGVRTYYITLGFDGTNQRVSWWGGPVVPSLLGTATLTGGDIYHTYEIRVAAGGSTASLYADGNPLVSGWTGNAATGQGAAAGETWFGAGSSGPGATENWASLAVTTVPEPASVTLLATGLLGLLTYAWRKRR